MTSRVRRRPGGPQATLALPGAPPARGGGGWLVVGIDLAWGERARDAVCFLRRGPGGRARLDGYASARGDGELLDLLERRASGAGRALLAIDGPMVCANPTGARPVDVLTHRLFGREHAGCHPASLARCPRPPRLLAALEARGWSAGWRLAGVRRLVAEVYPHPAIVRLCGLPRIVKYKRGAAAERRREFARLQRLLAALLRDRFPELAVDRETREVLAAPWTKAAEDRVDALVCALVGLWHVRHGGRRSQVLGDAATGFLVVPRPPARRGERVLSGAGSPRG